MPTASLSADGRMGPSTRSSSILFAVLSLPFPSPIPTLSGMSSRESAFERKGDAPRPARHSSFSASRAFDPAQFKLRCGEATADLTAYESRIVAKGPKGPGIPASSHRAHYLYRMLHVTDEISPRVT